MGGSSADIRNSFSRHKRRKSNYLTAGLFNRNDRSVLSSDADRDSWSNFPCSSDEAGAVSILARVFDSALGPKSFELAQRLLERHGSLSRVLSAEERFEDCPENEAYPIIYAACRLVEAGLSEQIAGSTVDPCDPALLKFLKLKFHNIAGEQLQSIFLDNKMRFIAHETLATGDDSKLMLNSSHLFRRCIDLGASALILAHNHPSGSAAPSQADRKSTTRLQKMAQFLGIELADHIIFGAGQAFSMRKGGML